MLWPGSDACYHFHSYSNSKIKDDWNIRPCLDNLFPWASRLYEMKSMQLRGELAVSATLREIMLGYYLGIIKCEKYGGVIVNVIFI